MQDKETIELIGKFQEAQVNFQTQVEMLTKIVAIQRKSLVLVSDKLDTFIELSALKFKGINNTLKMGLNDEIFNETRSKK